MEGFSLQRRSISVFNRCSRLLHQMGRGRTIADIKALNIKKLSEIPSSADLECPRLLSLTIGPNLRWVLQNLLQEIKNRAPVSLGSTLQINGQAEAANKSKFSRDETWRKERKVDWRNTQYSLVVLPNNLQRGHSETPFEMAYGVKAVIPLDMQILHQDLSTWMRRRIMKDFAYVSTRSSKSMV